MTDELRRLAEAATPGPWHDEFICLDYPDARDVRAQNYDTLVAGCLSTANAAYIAAANPQRILALLDVVEAGKGVLAATEHGTPLNLTARMVALREALDRLEALA